MLQVQFWSTTETQFSLTKFNLSMRINAAMLSPQSLVLPCLSSVIQNHDLFQDEEEVPPEAGKDQEETVEKTDEAAQEESETEEKSQGEKSKEEPQTEHKNSDEGSEKEEPQVSKLDFYL